MSNARIDLYIEPDTRYGHRTGDWSATFYIGDRVGNVPISLYFGAASGRRDLQAAHESLLRFEEAVHAALVDVFAEAERRKLAAAGPDDPDDEPDDEPYSSEPGDPTAIGELADVNP